MRPHVRERGRPHRDQVEIVCRTALDGLFVVDDQRRCISVNESGLRLVRAPAERLLGSRMDNFSPPEHLTILEGVWADFWRDRFMEGRYEILRADGSRTMIEYRGTWGFDAGRHLIAAREIRGCALPDAEWHGRGGIRLTARELEVLQLVADGQSGPEISGLLYVSVGTVKTHLKNIYGKLGARDRGSAVAAGLRGGLID